MSLDYKLLFIFSSNNFNLNDQIFCDLNKREEEILKFKSFSTIFFFFIIFFVILVK